MRARGLQPARHADFIPVPIAHITMQKRHALLIAFLGLTMVVPTLAHAQKAQDWALCRDANLPPEIVVSRCTAVINAAPSRDRGVIAFFARGVAYQRLNWLSSAIADYTEVLRLRPNEERTLNNRGLALHYKGEFKRLRISMRP